MSAGSSLALPSGWRRTCELRHARKCLAVGRVDEALAALSRVPVGERSHEHFQEIKKHVAAFLPQMTEAILRSPEQQTTAPAASRLRSRCEY